MAKEKSKHITVNNIDHWCSSLGFSFPRNEIEERNFDRLFRNYNYELTGEEIDPLKLLNELDSDQSKIRTLNSDNDLKWAARNFDGFTDDIIEKMKKNQNDKTSNGKGD